MSKANVLLVGSGGVGTMAAYALEAGDKAVVTAVLRSNFAAVSAKGFEISSIDHGDVKSWKPSHVVSQVPSQDAKAPFDYIVVTTKNFADVPPTVVDIIRPAVTPGHSVIVLIQNGLNIEAPVVAAFPQNVVLSGISYIGANETSPGVIHHTDLDRLGVGPFQNPHLDTAKQEAAARAFADLYGASGKVAVTLQPDFATVQSFRWRKLIYNACYNPICAITGLDSGRLRVAETPVADLLHPAMREIIATATAAGYPLSPDLVDVVTDTDPVDTFSKPSMQQDVEKGNFTEYENILGEPVRAAEKLGVPTPTLKLLYGIMKAIQWRAKEKKGLVSVNKA